MNIGIFFGGRSAEHKVSCISAASVFENIDKSKYTPYLIGVDYDGKMYHYHGETSQLKSGDWKNSTTENKVVILDASKQCGIYGRNTQIVFDIVFPVMHGPFGEDGKIQGVFEYERIPFVGPSVISAAITMDKDITKKILNNANINQVESFTVKSGENINELVNDIERLGYPLFIKPANMGSSVGIVKAKCRAELLEGYAHAKSYDSKIIIEKGHEIRELEIGVLGNREELILSKIGEIISCDEFYDYDAKYIKNESQLILPAVLSSDEVEQISNMASKAYKELDIEGMARIDFFIDKNTGEIYLNEVNTIPGFTHISMYPKLFEHSGIKYKDLISKLIDLAVERSDRQNELRYQ